jgi:hypothetical protein
MRFLRDCGTCEERLCEYTCNNVTKRFKFAVWHDAADALRLRGRTSKDSGMRHHTYGFVTHVASLKLIACSLSTTLHRKPVTNNAHIEDAPEFGEIRFVVIPSQIFY